MIRSLHEFMSLYDSGTRRALGLAVLLTAAISLFDFGALAVLYPVFGTLATGGSGTASFGPAFLTSADPKTLLVIAMILMIGRSILGFGVRAWWGRQASRAEVGLSARLVGAYAYAPYSFHLSSNSSDLMARSVAHVNMASASGLMGLVTITADGASAIAMVSALFLASASTGLAISAFLVLVGAAVSFISRRYVQAQANTFSQEVTKVYGRAADVLRGIRELTVANGRSRALESMSESREKMVNAQRNMLLLNEVPRLVLEVALYSAILGSLFLVLQGDDPATSLPLVALYVVAGLRILPAIARVLATQSQIRTGFEVGRELRQEIAEIELAGTQEHQPAGDLPLRGDLTLEDVSFWYDSGGTIFEDVELCVPFGGALGIVGPSGSGKTTLLAIMLGLLPPKSGSVRYGGETIGVADQCWLSKVAYVPQDVFILDDTVLANVALGASHPDRAAATEVLKRARLHDVVDALPDGLDTRLHEGGTRLSAGQRQRIGIARALYRDAKILLLDEPTASLDNETETRIVETLDALRGEVTIIVVAHRLRTLERVDRVLRLEDGVVSNER